MGPLSRPKTPPPARDITRGQLTPPSTAGKTSPKGSANTAEQLLTPPLTGKSVRFVEPNGSLTKSKRRRFGRKSEDEPALAEYTELDDLSDVSEISISRDSLVPSSTPSPTHASVSFQYTALTDKEKVSIDTNDEVLTDTNSVADSCFLTSPFPFMRLPLSIRKEIYSLLLVVPGLICVRQNHTSYHNEEKAFLYAETRALLPGIAYALPQPTVGGFKVRFSRFQHVNAGILRVSKAVHAEAKAIMYGANDFEIVCPNLETSPPPDYTVPLFPSGYSPHVRSLSIRVRALYPLKWLLNGGYSEIKNAYHGLERLNIVFEMESATKGVGKVLGKKEDERWVAYVTRLHKHLSTTIIAETSNRLPVWIHLRVLFDGESYDSFSEPSTHNVYIDMGPGNTSPTDAAEERLKRYHLKRGLPEAFEMCKNGEC